MSVLVDYQCRTCLTTTERWVNHPAPSRVCCSCGEAALRRYGFGRIARSTEVPTDPSGQGPMGQLDVPGVCHMSATEARRWSASLRGDTAAEHREIEYQEKAIDAGTLNPNPPADVCAH